MASGGARAGAGTKPKILTALLLDQPDAAKHIATAFKLFVDVMGNEEHPIATRMDAASEVLNRLCGKPAQAVVLSGDADQPPVQAEVLQKRQAAASELRQWQQTLVDGLATLVLGPEGNPMRDRTPATPSAST